MNIKKNCACCQTRKLSSDFNIDSSRSDGLCIYCKECSSKKYKKYYNSNDKILSGIRERRSNWSGKKKKEIQEQKRVESKKRTENLSDSYIQNVLIHKNHVNKDLITPEMIEAKRAQIKRLREAKMPIIRLKE